LVFGVTGPGSVNLGELQALVSVFGSVDSRLTPARLNVVAHMSPPELPPPMSQS
jgi:hypothetical protein